MKISEVTYNSNPITYNVGNGVSITYKKHQFEAESNFWTMNVDSDQIGYVNVQFYKELKFPSLDAIFITDHTYRNLGLGRKIVRVLINHYGGLCSDPQGATNNNAVKMWQALGAEKVSTNKNTKGFYYQVEK